MKKENVSIVYRLVKLTIAEIIMLIFPNIYYNLNQYLYIPIFIGNIALSLIGFIKLGKTIDELMNHIIDRL